MQKRKYQEDLRRNGPLTRIVKWSSKPAGKQMCYRGVQWLDYLKKLKGADLHYLIGVELPLGTHRHNWKKKKKRLEELCQLNNADHVNTIKELKGEISTLIHQEELAWWQRSRSIWLLAGDKNTKYFHQRASQCRRKNQILGVLDSEGNWCTSEDRIAQVAESYFQNFFTSAHSNNIDSVLRTVERRITPQMNDNLTQRYTT